MVKCRFRPPLSTRHRAAVLCSVDSSCRGSLSYQLQGSQDQYHWQRQYKQRNRSRYQQCCCGYTRLLGIDIRWGVGQDLAELCAEWSVQLKDDTHLPWLTWDSIDCKGMTDIRQGPTPHLDILTGSKGLNTLICGLHSETVARRRWLGLCRSESLHRHDGLI